MRLLLLIITGGCIALNVWLVKPYHTDARVVAVVGAVVAFCINPVLFSLSGFLIGARRARLAAIIGPSAIVMAWLVGPAAWAGLRWGFDVFGGFFLRTPWYVYLYLGCNASLYVVALVVTQTIRKRRIKRQGQALNRRTGQRPENSRKV